MRVFILFENGVAVRAILDKDRALRLKKKGLDVREFPLNPHHGVKVVLP